MGFNMNERANELIKSIPNLKYDASTGLFETDRKALYDLIELTIQECATIILNNDIEKQEDYGVNHLFFNGWERGVIDSCQIIKEHFGVEE
jgi:hypothetical protein